jgi:hypothetical protein
LKAAPKANGNGKKDAPREKKTIPEKVPRMTSQDYIMKALVGQKEGLSIDQLEIACQKLHKHAEGRYSHVARQQFVCNKGTDGKITVMPAVSDKGFLFGAEFSLENGGLHWTLRTFPKEALESLRMAKFAKVEKVEALLKEAQK